MTHTLTLDQLATEIETVTSSSDARAVVNRALRCATRGPSYRRCLQHTQQQAGPLTCNNLRRSYS